MQAVARKWRYQQLLSMAEEQGCSVVVTGHTATDQAETLIFNMIRWEGFRRAMLYEIDHCRAPGLCSTRHITLNQLVTVCGEGDLDL